VRTLDSDFSLSHLKIRADNKYLFVPSFLLSV
jgi:hypothetical protein